jgi:hypothetical protein
MGGLEFLDENRPIVVNDCLADTSIVVLVANDATATGEKDQLCEECRAVPILVLFAASPAAARRGSVRERARCFHAANLP